MGKYDVTIDGKDYEIDAPDEDTLRQTINKLKEESMPDFSDVVSGGEEFKPKLTPTSIMTASLRGGKMPETPEEEKRLEEGQRAGFGAATQSMVAIPAAAGAVANPIGFAKSIPGAYVGGHYVGGPIGKKVGSVVGMEKEGEFVGDIIGGLLGGAYSGGMNLGKVGSAMESMPYGGRWLKWWRGLGTSAPEAAGSASPHIPEIPVSPPAGASSTPSPVSTSIGSGSSGSISPELAEMATTYKPPTMTVPARPIPPVAAPSIPKPPVVEPPVAAPPTPSAPVMPKDMEPRIQELVSQGFAPSRAARIAQAEALEASQGPEALSLDDLEAIMSSYRRSPLESGRLFGE